MSTHSPPILIPLPELSLNGNGAALNPPDGAESHVERLPESAPVSGSETRLEHWCEEHRMAYTRKTGEDAWWSHKAPDGSWSRE